MAIEEFARRLSALAPAPAVAFKRADGGGKKSAMADMEARP
jgi:hypothetical protein